MPSVQLPSIQSGSDSHCRIIRAWLLAVATLIFAIVVVGGATRLTESGLSIVEWKPVTGALPPLGETAWQAEFGKYQTIPQYRELNRGMTLDEFKVIYWWEWTHRLLGRIIGAAFLLPFLFFAWRGWIRPEMRGRFWTIFGLGALQGGVGWWMVASGLTERVNVSQYRLAFHLTLACVIFAAILWTAQRLLPAKSPAVASRGRAGARTGAIVLLVLVICQIYLGALVAGSHAGLVYNTWPLIDGSFIPDGSSLLFLDPWWRNFFENTLTVQFVHRMVAYSLWIVAVGHALAMVRNASGEGRFGAVALASAVTVQAAIGILTLLHQVPIGLGLLHQGMAAIVLAIAVMHAESLTPRHHSAPSTARQPLAEAA
jgi:cytochrome c oxidase assembly protein subunit 15